MNWYEGSEIKVTSIFYIRWRGLHESNTGLLYNYILRVVYESQNARNIMRRELGTSVNEDYVRTI